MESTTTAATEEVQVTTRVDLGALLGVADGAAVTLVLGDAWATRGRRVGDAWATRGRRVSGASTASWSPVVPTSGGWGSEAGLRGAQHRRSAGRCWQQACCVEREDPARAADGVPAERRQVLWQAGPARPSPHKGPQHQVTAA
ncbi:uncharacterized protein LOC126143482 [Schistocerca cancellata]|uniref:uncharacterized protein LOC126143482 n=1 Tax=Schistocerca cancellata TaxID=274614 RepID=UPI0021176D16|nr:uncharacterized protein LOC126143482 [Schistocerca cancellata]